MSSLSDKPSADSNDLEEIKCRIVVGGVSNVSKEELHEIFSKYGEINDISITSNYGFIQFSSEEDAETAMEDANGLQIRDTTLHVRSLNPESTPHGIPAEDPKKRKPTSRLKKKRWGPDKDCPAPPRMGSLPKRGMLPPFQDYSSPPPNYNPPQFHHQPPPMGIAYPPPHLVPPPLMTYPPPPLVLAQSPPFVMQQAVPQVAPPAAKSNTELVPTSELPLYWVQLQNLPRGVGSEDISNFFGQLSVLQGVTQLIGGERGVGFVAFQEDGDLLKALSVNGNYIKGNKIKVLLATSQDVEEAAAERRAARKQKKRKSTPSVTAESYRSRKVSAGEPKRGDKSRKHEEDEAIPPWVKKSRKDADDGSDMEWEELSDGGIVKEEEEEEEGYSGQGESSSEEETPEHPGGGYYDQPEVNPRNVVCADARTGRSDFAHDRRGTSDDVIRDRVTSNMNKNVIDYNHGSSSRMDKDERVLSRDINQMANRHREASPFEDEGFYVCIGNLPSDIIVQFLLDYFSGHSCVVKEAFVKRHSHIGEAEAFLHFANMRDRNYVMHNLDRRLQGRVIELQLISKVSFRDIAAEIELAKKYRRTRFSSPQLPSF